MQKKRLKVIPNRIFHKLWDLSEEYPDPEGYINAISSNRKICNFRSYDLDYDEFIDVLKKIYGFRHIKLKDISDQTQKRKSELSHIFCIPIRTIEAWYSDINPMPSYILLMMLKYFHLLNLGKYVRLESEIEYTSTKPSIYRKKEQKDDDLIKYEYPLPDEKSEYEKFMESKDYDSYLDSLIERVKNNRKHTSF